MTWPLEDKPLASVVVRDDSSLDLLPVWVWDQQSCSLDAVLVSLVTIAHHLKGDFAQLAACGSPVSRQAAIEVMDWGNSLLPAWNWQSSTAEHLTRLRDKLRRILGDRHFVDSPIHVNSTTPVDSTLEQVLLPPDLLERFWTSRFSCPNHSEHWIDYCPTRGIRGVSLVIRDPKEWDLQQLLDRHVTIPAKPD